MSSGATEAKVVMLDLPGNLRAIVGGYPAQREVCCALQCIGSNQFRVVLELTPDASLALAEALRECANTAGAIALQ